MTARRTLLLALLLAASSVIAWGQQGPFTIVPTALPIGGGVFVVGQTIPVQQFGTSPPLDESFTWSISSGNLPPGLNFDPAFGVITGTPTQAGAFTFTVFSQEVGTNFTANRNYTLYVSLGTPLSLTPIPHPQAAIGSFYVGPTFQVGGGVPGYTWAFQSGTNSDGLTINSSSGQLSGAPLAGGVFAIGIAVTDASGVQTFATFNLNVLSISTASLPSGALGTSYSRTLAAIGATGALSWSVTSTTLPPPGLTLTPQGQIAGTPTASGAFPFQVRVTDSATKLSSSKSFNISITSGTLAITTTSLPNGIVGTAYSQTLTATGSTNPLTWSLVGAPTFPDGLGLSAQGQITGTPKQAGTYPFQVQVTDPLTSLSATQALSITIAGGVGISPGTLPDGFINVPYAATTLTVPGVTISNWAVTTGALPAGLTLNASTGVISGTPTVVGSSTFIVSATPAAVVAALPPVVQTFTLLINAPPSVNITGLASTSPAAQQGAAAVTLSGGIYPLNITGTMTLTFAPASGGSQIYDAKFATGTGTTATFTIPAGTSQGLFGTAPNVPVMSGTVAGTITITTVLQDSAGNTLTPPAPIVITVDAAAPVITKGAFSSANGSFSISVTGYSTPRDMTSALFHFTPTTTAPLTSADVTIALSSVFTEWYNSSTSNAFGSQFTMKVPFTFAGPPGATVPCIAVAVTLTNSKGASAPFNIACQPVAP